MGKKPSSRLRQRGQASQRETEQLAGVHREEEQVAIGLNCIRCGIPLQIAASTVPEVRASLDRTGHVFLICVCGQLQLVGYSQRPLHD